MSSIRILPLSLSTSQKIIVVSVTAGVTILGLIASYCNIRRKTPRPLRRPRTCGRRTRNSMRSPNDILSIAGSKASARSISPGAGGSIHAISERLSLASGSMGGGGGVNNIPLTPQQLGVMGMEALQTVINCWEDAVSAHNLGGSITMKLSDDTEFCNEIQNLLDLAYTLQDQSELLFLDQQSVLFRDEDQDKQLTNGHRSHSDPNIDSGESFASALDQIADLREFEDYSESFLEIDNYPLYQNAMKELEDHSIPYRMMRTELVNCSSDIEYLAKLHCIRLAFQLLFKDDVTSKWVADTGRQVLTDLLCLGDKDPKDFLVGYESMLEYVSNSDNWASIENELKLRNVKAMTFYDIVLDFIILDAFKDLDSPPGSVIAVIQNRFLSDGFKETALITAVWSILKAKKRLLKFPNGFMSHFYSISEQISPLMVWGFFGPDENLREVCQYFRDETMSFMSDIYNFQKCRFVTLEDLAADILENMKKRVANIGIKFSQ